ncbi:Ornithine carbamoyltransferase [Desulfurobacterium thermolithotrophum DSM 11699]|uniref:Ornithine carbamoyltransferase n=1 Tax=Desulfurobacterium thermolithotrophum (strain DSM 11699 / BSA) TaxID=868864 RepID=F0S1M1_DESTD|nr:ornithine carbamoyltransferase [Desulfurobacterium thermolithotrophum]ADY74024.1 Ornithine carbamoyltransferase [Desulfurobacterium thermolithotrophum DSM 11699]
MKDFISMVDADRLFIENIISLSSFLKEKQKKGELYRPLEGFTAALIFEKPSTRTRVSFEVGVYQLGGHGIYMDNRSSQLGRGEPIKDTARVLSRYVNLIVIRTFGQERVEELAKYSDVPVINALTDEEHPCQVLADIFTIWEYKRNLKGLKVAYVGDGNNMCNSWLIGAAYTGMKFYAATPKGFEPLIEYVEKAKEIAKDTGAEIVITNNPIEAVKEADIIYTDVWASMGQEDEAEKRKEIFMPYQVNRELVKHAKSDFLFMHCLPAHRGEEVTNEIIESDRSIVWDQAENRLHTQKALILKLVRKVNL